MPLLLCRYILVELLKVLALTAAVLVTVIAFGAAVKPLANNTLLDTSQTLKYILLATVPMMQFALPFAAGFAATIVLHRSATDNEVLAMSVSGISYRQILMPIAAMGVILTAVMIVLTQGVIPRFWQLMKQTVVSDVTELFQASIDRGQPFATGDIQIYAQKMVVEHDPPDRNADVRLQLWRVAAGELNDDGSLEKDITAGRAIADLYRLKGQTILKLKLLEAVAYDRNSGGLVSVPEINRSIYLPNVLDDNTKLMSRAELLRLRADPDQYQQLRNKILDLAQVLDVAEQERAIQKGLEREGNVRLQSIDNEQRRYVIGGAQMKKNHLVGVNGQPVQIEQLDDGRVTREFTAELVMLSPSAAPLEQQRTVDVTLDRCTVREPGSTGPPNQRDHLVLQSLTVEGAATRELYSMKSDALLERAAPFEATHNEVANKAQLVRDKIVSVRREITARLQNRYALSFTAMLLLLLGSTLAIYLRNSSPLVVYLWAFLPSMLDLMMISSGEQLLRRGDPLALPCLWGGSAIMVVIIIWAFLRLRRN